MTVSFVKKISELDAYLQLLIEQQDQIDKKISVSENQDGLMQIKKNLDSLLASIKRSIVLLQIAKVSIQTASSSTYQGSPPAAEALQQEEEIFFDAPDEPIGLSMNCDAFYEDEEEEDVDGMKNQGSVIRHLMSQIKIGMDLTKVVLPTFILERRSLLEMYADFFAHPDLFSSIVDFDTPEKRMVQLVKWYLSAFHAGRKSSVAKKPYNPILGEIFSCQWSNNLSFVAEQVSHHPPVSAFYAENPDKKISCCAHIYTRSKYLGLSVGVHNIGKGVIRLSEHNETYVCTFPSAYGRSILTVPWVELGGTVNISCEQSGYSAKIEFVTKPFYGGKKHRVIGEILRPNKEPFISIDGEWNGVIHYKSPPNSGDEQVFVDTTNLPVIKKHVRSISSQETFESRNVWKEVTRALKLRDVHNATEAKSFIEQRQRDLLKDRQEKGIKWKTRYFEPDGDSWVYRQ